MVDLLPLKSMGALRTPRGPHPGPPPGPPPGSSSADGQLGILKSRLFSALESLEGSNLLSGLSSRLETALSLSQDSTSPSGASGSGPPGSRQRSPGPGAGNAVTAATPAARGSLLSPDDAAAAAALKLRSLREQAGGSDDDKKRPSVAPVSGRGGQRGAAGAARGEEAASCATDRTDRTDERTEGGAEAEERLCRPALPQACGPDPYEKLQYKMEAASSSSGSDGDGYGPSTSIDSPDHDAKYWVRSGSEGSVRSWASSLSLDSQSDEATALAVEFMRKYVAELFATPADISLEQKAKFGQLAQTEAGRLWFARFVNAQRVHNKRVSESTFYSLVQHFAIVLFECADADDFGPSKSLMNMCFTFYHEVDVPGCEPYREYLSVYLREQPIWHSLRFWNAALFDALQCERQQGQHGQHGQHGAAASLDTLDAEQEYQENVTFGQLGTFTCNMHAFGLSRELCTEFLRKQCVIANLREDQEKMLRENVERMYSETDPWRSQ